MNIKQILKNIIIRVYQNLRLVFPSLYYFIQYSRAASKMGNLAKERDELFNKLIAGSTTKKCLQIGVKEDIGAKFGSNWVSVDQFDMRDFIDFHYDIHDLKFVDSEFDIVVCISILEHIPYPEKALKELYRVLKPGGEIWVQLPFHFPYHEAPKDYWRASPDGLRIWMKDFQEIRCGSFLCTKTSLVTSTFFYGAKTEAFGR
ncbi:MAG: class I SAM-dependent methyltransferase [Symploca sp. SIO1B1]|nr:class I SAM-dependent methyltransferase [Symploca sp. SIO1C2]NER45417.1 class I SAM-dependent methyltransferase [Symploca sp. SIO1A3]NER92802.1 class I SAM-dependent methyltransferase [Symploca sp. SIO1B1]